MSNTEYITPEEHISFLIIERYNDNSAFVIQRMKAKEDFLDKLNKIYDSLTSALINIPNLSRARSNSDEGYFISGNIKKEDSHIYNKKGESDPLKYTIFTSGKYKELMEKGETNILESPNGVYKSNTSLFERIKSANEKAKSIIEACELKIKEIEENKSNIPYHDDCYIKDGMIYFSGKVSDFSRILILKTKFQAKFLNLVEILGNNVHFYQTNKKLKDTRVKYNFARYKIDVKEGNLDLDPDLIKITNKCIDKILGIKLNQNSPI